MTADKIKCLVWDLDQTLWEGRLLEGDEPQLRPGIVKILNEMDTRGILLSIASTNDHDSAMSYLNDLGVAKFFVVPEIHMGSKHESIERIASRLNLQFVHIGFIDDDPFERDLVWSFHKTIQIFDAAEYVDLLDDSRFIPQVVSIDGHRRRKLIKAQMCRQRDEIGYGDLEEFLKACKIRFAIRRAEEKDIDRVVELTLRTNRMNASGRQYTFEDIVSMISDKTTNVLVATMEDRYGDYGTIAAAILRRYDMALRAEALWISCRVAKRGLPQAVFSALANCALKQGAVKLEIDYHPTRVNRLAAFHMGLYGFCLEETSQGKQFSLSLPRGIRPYPVWLQVKS